MSPAIHSFTPQTHIHHHQSSPFTLLLLLASKHIHLPSHSPHCSFLPDSQHLLPSFHPLPLQPPQIQHKGITKTYSPLNITATEHHHPLLPNHNSTMSTPRLRLLPKTPHPHPRQTLDLKSPQLPLHLSSLHKPSKHPHSPSTIHRTHALHPSQLLPTLHHRLNPALVHHIHQIHFLTIHQFMRISPEYSNFIRWQQHSRMVLSSTRNHSYYFLLFPVVLLNVQRVNGVRVPRVTINCSSKIVDF